MEGAHKAIDSIPVSNDIELNANNFWVPEKENPIIIDIPPKIESETIIDFPAIPKELGPQITGVPADSVLDEPSIEVFPTPEKSSMDDLVLMNESVNKVIPEKVINDLTNYKTKRWIFDNEEFILDKSGMKHILKRHHPEYWDGSVKSTQTFLDKDMSIDDITNTISKVLKQNREILIKKGTLGMYQVEGTVNGSDYIVGLNKGRVGQFYRK